MPYTVAEAAKAIGKSKAAVFRAISKGKLSATREETRGVFLIDPAELHRVFPPAEAALPDTHRDTMNGTSRDGPSQPGDTLRFAELQGRLADAHQTIDDLRGRLDAESEERRRVQAQLTALLTDQRAAAPAAPGEAHAAKPPASRWGRFLAWRRQQ